jgi:ubiquinone/menaquinone biosynthesis C-methylase UbiE
MRLVCGDQPDLRENFENVGRTLAGALRKLEMLEPGARLLDIGCGCGRVARQLLDSPIAEYAGFDRHAGMIDWAQSHISAIDDRFNFQYVDVQSGYAELDSDIGSVAADEFVFPYEDGAFTGVLASSVFTHIDFSATRRYLSEAARVLAADGRVLATFFSGETTGPMEGSGWNFVIREADLRGAIERARLNLLLLTPPVQASSRHSWALMKKPETEAPVKR